MQISGSVILVTGSARRVGKAIATALTQKGARVAIHYRTSHREALRLAKELKGKYRAQAEVFKADLSKKNEVERLARDVYRRFHRIDVLVNNASVYYKTPFGKVTERNWDEHLNANLKGPFFLSQAVGVRMKKAGRGKIVNLCDWAGVRPYSGYAPYCVSKAGLICLTHALAKALAPRVQVNAVLPGPVLLPQGIGAREREAIRQATLLKRIGTPKDVASAVCFLVEGSDFMTGATISVDGGRLIK